MQRRPPGFTQTWPISPAEPRPCTSRPSSTSPPPTPVPQKTPRNDCAPRPAPKRRSASTATLTSLPTTTGTPEALRQDGAERERPVPAFDVRDLDHRTRVGVDAPGRAHADPCQLGDADSRGGRRLRDGDRDVLRDLRRAAARRRAAPRAAEHRAVPVGDDGLDLRPAEVHAGAEAGGHGRRRTTSSSGCRFARALHSSALKADGSRARCGCPKVSTIAGASSSRELEHGARGVAVDHAVRAGGDALVPCGEQHVLRGAACVERQRPLAADDDRDDEPGPEHVGGHGHGRREGVHPLAALRNDEGPRLPVPRRAREATRVEDPRDELVRERLRPVAALVATARDREARVHPSSVGRG